MESPSPDNIVVTGHEVIQQDLVWALPRNKEEEGGDCPVAQDGTVSTQLDEVIPEELRYGWRTLVPPRQGRG